MSNDISLEILDKAKEWFKNIIAINHISNTRKLKKSSEFNINPFLAVYSDYSHELEETINQLAQQDDVKNLSQ